MRILFLDIDGVLNSERYVRRCGYTGVVIDPAKMELLKQIIDATGARIVLSTSWREHWSSVEEACDETGSRLNTLFNSYGLSIFEKTPVLNAGREREIGAWLESHPETADFAVVDDRFLSAGFLAGHFVKTSNFGCGLDEKSAADIIAILTGKGIG